MPSPLAQLYDLALRALDEQDRRADALRGRLGPVLAAAALGASLLSGPVIGGAHPASAGGKLGLAVAICGLLLETAATFRLLTMRRGPLDDIDVRRLATDLQSLGVLDDEGEFYEAMIIRICERIDRRANAVEETAASFTAMLWGILLMLCGLALAAIVG